MTITEPPSQPFPITATMTNEHDATAEINNDTIMTSATTDGATSMSAAATVSKSKGKGKANAMPSMSASKVASQSIENLPWVEKYRPSSLDDMVSQKDIITTINKFVDMNRLPHLLFYGPPGTGKTTAVLACARKIYGDKYKQMILELNASDDRGINVVRDQIKTFASTRKIFSSGYKMIILDEADAMTNAAQAALRRIVEKYTKNVRFCLICNYVNKIIPAIQSRCTKFRFSPLAEADMRGRIEFIIKEEGVNITEGGKAALLRLAQGDMRKALHVLQSCASAYDHIDADQVYFSTGCPTPSNIETVVSWLFNEDYATAYTSIINLKATHGLSLQDIVREVFLFLRDYNITDAMRIYLTDKLADLQYRLAQGCEEDVQLASMVGAFHIARHLPVA